MKEFINGLQHIGIPTDDMEATIGFYNKIGFEIAYETVNEGDRVVFLEAGGLILETYEVTNPKKEHGAIDHIAIDVKDIEKVFDEINKMGLNNLSDTIHFLPFWKNGVRFFNIEGPNNEKIEFCQRNN